MFVLQEAAKLFPFPEHFINISLYYLYEVMLVRKGLHASKVRLFSGHLFYKNVSTLDCYRVFDQQMHFFIKSQTVTMFV